MIRRHSTREKATVKCQILILIFFPFPHFNAAGNTSAELTSPSSHLSVLSLPLSTVSSHIQPPFFSNQKVCVAFVFLRCQRLWGWFLKCRWSLWVAPRSWARRRDCSGLPTDTSTKTHTKTLIKGHLLHTDKYTNVHTYIAKYAHKYMLTLYEAYLDVECLIAHVYCGTLTLALALFFYFQSAFQLKYILLVILSHTSSTQNTCKNIIGN